MNYDAKVATILLMKGIFYKNDNENAWLEMVEQSRGVMSDYFGVIGLTLEIDEVQGYAYLKNMEQEDDDAKPLPKLINSRELSYKVSLLCVLLRKRVVDFEMQSDSSRAIVSKEEIVQNLLLFFEEKFNEVKMQKEIEATIKKVEELGFLKKLKSSEQNYEIRSAIKAFVDAQWLGDFEEKLEAYKEHGWS
ncbi:FIG039767: hypothetical protein [hydrothermal vent metagenome]|uniref:DUF4194 domain-containing protein n=1 Tax=hydrothermal vent metagenome TaxID=652676 RepID=A0A1W1BET8_9ZZZZ